jgi:hypothetical protein
MDRPRLPEYDFKTWADDVANYALKLNAYIDFLEHKVEGLTDAKKGD